MNSVPETDDGRTSSLPRRSVAWMLVLAIVAGTFTAAVGAVATPEQAEAGVFFNDTEFTYKEYWTPHSTFTGGCFEDELPPGAFYIEPLDCTKEITLPIPDDVSHAIAAVVYVDLWRNKTANSARFTINDGPQYRPPVGWDYSRTVFSATVPVTQLRQGANSLKFQEASGPYHVHDVMVRVYYDNTRPILPGPNSDVVPPSGSLLTVQAGTDAPIPAAAGGVLNVDANQVALTANATGAAYVEFHGYYDGYDEDNDGVTLDWHNFLRNNFGPGGTTPRPNGATIGHIGTDATADTGGIYTATWNMPQVVNQTGVKFKVRIVDNQGNVREVAGGVSGPFELRRSYSVEKYVIPNFQDAGIYFRTMLPQLHTDTIDLPSDLAAVDRAFVIGNYWNSPDLSINGAQGFQVFNVGEDIWNTSIREISPALLKPGENVLRWSHRAPSFGSMVERPGPMVVIHRHAPSGPPMITIQPKSALIQEGEAATLTAAASGAPNLAYQWFVDGAPVPGATAATYVTPALLATDDGSRYTVTVTNALGSATSNEAMINVAAAPSAAAPWWNATWDYRVPLTVFPQGVDRQDKVVEQAINFSTLMSDVGAGGPTFDPNSIRVVEIDQNGAVVNANVPFQFDRAVDYDAIANATGTIVWQMPGLTPAGQGRSFHVYFDKTSKNIAKASVVTQVSRQAVVDQGFNAIQFNLGDGSHWVFHGTDGGGFSKVTDRNGVEWVGWSPAEGSAGDFRGVPNAVKPPAGFFHPGRLGRTKVRIVSEGPLKIRMEVTAIDDTWVSVWDMYPTHGDMTVTRGNKEWWFLWEGIAGGEVDPADFVQFSNGQTVAYDGVFEGDMPEEEWAYAADPADGKAFFVAHHENDGSVESYRLLDGQLPILGFGRGGLGLNEPLLSKKINNEPQHFTVGLAESTAVGPTSAHIRDTYQDVLIVAGKGEFHGVRNGALTDDFSSASLKPFWTYTDNVHDTSLTLTGTQLAITMPAGIEHNSWSGGIGDKAPRLMQPIGDTDLDLVAKFESQPTTRFQGQGLVLMQDTNNWVRLVADHDGTRNRVVIQQMIGGVGTVLEKINLPGVTTRYLRIIRTGDVFTFRRSYDGIKWFDATATRTIPLDLTQAGVTAFTASGATSPAYTAIVDYFESKTNGGLNDDAPIITDVNVVAKARSATITWTTNTPSTTVLGWGPTISQGEREADTTLVTSHSVSLDYLRCDAPYFFRPQSASDVGLTNGAQVSFRTLPCPSVVSDDFSTGSLGSHWTLFDPVGDTLTTLSSTNAIVSVPGGVEHNLFPGENFATRLRQEAPVADFSVDAKFESVLNSRFQTEGIVVEQDMGNFLRFEVHHDGTQVRSFMAAVVNNVSTTYNYGVLPSTPAQYVRVVHAGNTWTMLFSSDGTSWTTVGQMVVDLQPSYVGPYIGATGAGNDTPPAFIGSIDYFFATDHPLVDDGGSGPDTTDPVISDIVIQPGVPHAQAATVSWTTNEPATTRVDWGPTTAYGSGPLVVNTATLTHSAVIQPLNCGSTYHMKFTSNDAAGNDGSSPNQPVVTPACPAGAFSDNFDTPTLDPRWWLSDPRADSQLELPSGLAALTVPAGVRHDITRQAITAPRILQPVPNGDFDVKVGFESVVNFQTQLQGIVFEADDQNLVRFDLFSDGTTTQVFVGERTRTNLVQRAMVPVPPATPGALRVTRVGTTWSFFYSPDHGTTWQPIWTGIITQRVTRMGPYAGNGNPVLANVPQHTALIDYFWSTSDPITITEPQSLEGPQFELFGSTGAVWDGSPFDFGGLGLTQPDINIRGRVTDESGGITSLTYSVNGGNPRKMDIGTTTCPAGGVSCTRRLAHDGDFNADIDASLLNPGANTVVLRAIDAAFHVRSVSVPVNYTPGNTWPLPYSIDWSTVTDLNDVAQPVDGRWVVEGDHVTVPASDIGYDRLLTVGDSSWHSFEAEVPITINSFDPEGYLAPSGGPGVGFIPHWRGHTQVGTDQPKWGFAGRLGALVWYRYRDDQNGERLEIRDSNAALVAEDLSARTLSIGVTYIFKLQVETGGGAGPLYRLKVWQQGTPEPATWDIITSLPAGVPDTGSLALVAHHVDADFGNLDVRQITAGAPTISPTPGAYAGLAKIEMATDTRAGEIHYTLDGSDPTLASPLYTEPFFLLEPATIKAQTFREGFIASPVTTQAYNITPPPTRIAHDLQALYRFDEGSGSIVHDTSFNGAPIDLTIEAGSDVTWMPAASALRVNAASNIRTPSGANRLNTAIVASQSFTVEAWLDPSSLELANGTLFNIAPRIAGQQNLEIMQQGRSLDVNMRTTNTNADGIVGRNTGSVLQPQLHHLVYVRRPDNTTIVYIDGQQAWTSIVNGSLNGWGLGYGLAIANSAEGVNPWQGDLYSMAVYSDDLTPAEITTNYQAGPFGAPANYAPVVSAGADIILVQGETAVMAATATDDGHPTPANLTTTWTQVGGPGTASIANPSSATTTVGLPVAGTYTFRWTGSDGEKTTVDEMTITAIPAGSQAPAPDVTPVSGPYPLTVNVTMTSAVPAAEIRYTLDGNDPTPASTLYTGPFAVTTTGTVKARIYRAGLTESPVTQRDYTVTADTRVTANLVAFYPFNEPSGASIKDKSGFGNALNLTVLNTGRMTRLPSGVRLDQPTTIVSDSAATKINNAVKATNELTVELWLEPAATAQVNSMVLGVSANSNARNLAVIQRNATADVNLRSRATNTKGEPPTTANGALPTAMTHFVFTRNAAGATTVYVNGVVVATGNVGSDLGNWVNSHILHLGGELDGTRSWLGTYYLLAIYNRSLTSLEVLQNYALGDA